MPSITFYPDAHPETTTVDGPVARSGADLDWSSIRDGLGFMDGEPSETAQTWCVRIQPTATTDHYRELWRSGFLFDTSPLASLGTPIGATFSIYITSKDNSSAVGGIDFDVFTFTPSNNLHITASTDFQRFGTVSQTGIPLTYSEVTTGAYNNLVFNAIGVGNINVNGVSGFGLRNASYDGSGAIPTWADTYPANSGYQAYFSEASGTSTDPALTVVYVDSELLTVYADLADATVERNGQAESWSTIRSGAGTHLSLIHI